MRYVETDDEILVFYLVFSSCSVSSKTTTFVHIRPVRETMLVRKQVPGLASTN